jgi:two-component system CheB/CheR fusion protein
LLLSQYSPPAVLVNEAGDILYVSGRTGRYLEPAAGRANWNIHVMLRPGLRAQIAAAMRTSVETRQPVELQGLSIDDDGGARVDVVVRAVQEPSSLSGTLLVVFRDAPSKSRARRRSAGAVDTHASDELMRSRDEIQALRREMRASQEELQAANEELQSTNEELQSANEELTTAQEEAQSMNEELRTINNELQTKLDDLALAQSDMQNLLNSTNIATLFLDGELRVRRFTDQVARVIHLREGDVGRPLSDLATTLVYPQLQAQAREVMQTLVHCEQEIATTDGAWYAVRIMPYRTLTNRINGVVITFVDITVAKTLEARLRTHGTEQGSGP